MKSEATKENPSISGGSKLLKSNTTLMSRWAQESTSEAMELLNKFTQWRENSRRQLIDIIDSYNESIDEGFNDLVKEVSDLHTKVSVIKDEIYDLPEKVLDFSDCLTVEMPLKVNLVEEDENTNPNLLEGLDPSSMKNLEKNEMKGGSLKIEEKIKDLQHRFGNRVIISQKINQEYRIANQVVTSQNQVPLKEEATFSESIFEDNVKNKADEEESKENVAELVQNYISARNKRLGKKFTCDHCQYETTSRQDLLTHKEKYDHHKKWKCDRCSFETRASKTHLNIHINDAHDKIRKYSCEQCGYAATQKGSLQKHKLFVHKLGDKKFKCDKCSFASVQRGNLVNHIRHVHEKIPHKKDQVCELCGIAFSKRTIQTHKESVHKLGKEFKCQFCPFITYRKVHLKRHVDGLHEKRKDHICDECGHATNQKSDLKSHMATVHKIGVKLKCEQCSLEVYSQRNLKQHIRSVHMGIKRKKKGKTEKEDMKSQEDEQLDEEESEEEEEHSQEEKMQVQDDQERPQEDGKHDQEIENKPHDESESEDDAVEVS